ncbi:Short-chain dehydrogenase/reductase family protein [Mycena venus]|uniref:Short-chain dehydrogenase/reductase family protein n=1 Tax=Mycena venus TaxID=2733690 RepID=A0A8H6X4N6_9AGAR|nr:Short-chain dehydrogenase/reductase family protein [Mycena venus]
MNPLALLFYPTLRVYNLRLLLLADVMLIVLLGISVPRVASIRFAYYRAPVVAGFPCAIVVLVHHILAVFKWPVSGLAFVDLVVVVVEMGIISYSRANYQDMDLTFVSQLITLDVVALLKIIALAQIVFLAISIVLRISTILRLRTREGFLRQRLVFLGGCEPSHPPYTVTSILLNRSLARPLVRGESKIVIGIRALVISVLGVLVPAFGVYSIVMLPAQSEVYTKFIASSALMEADVVGALDGQASLYFTMWLTDEPPSWALNLTSVSPHIFQDFPTSNLTNVTLTTANSRPAQCLSHLQGFSFTGRPVQYGKIRWRVQCSVGWSEIIGMSITLTVPAGSGAGAATGLYVAPWYSDEGFVRWPDTMDLDYKTLNQAPTILLPGSARFGLLSWTARRRRGSRSAWQYEPEIIDLQTDPSVQAPGPSTAVLTLSHWARPRRFVEDVSDASVISGISNLGGLWTFVNGAFALLFGANVIYLAFGRRPLSALGVIHLFQRRALVRKWHEDFPALHTEGGTPGSQSAGIIAFIRERIVDIDDPESVESEAKLMESRGLASEVDVDEQGSPESLPLRYLRSHSGYIVDTQGSLEGRTTGG